MRCNLKMLKKTAITLFLLIFIVGCDIENIISDIKSSFKRKESMRIQQIQANNISQNTTNATVPQERKFEYFSAYPNIFITKNSILIMDRGKNYLIDADKENLKILSLIEQLNIKEFEFVLLTLNKENKNSGFEFVLTRTTSKVLYDNGISDASRINYLDKLQKYNQYWNKTTEVSKEINGGFIENLLIK